MSEWCPDPRELRAVRWTVRKLRWWRRRTRAVFRLCEMRPADAIVLAFLFAPFLLFFCAVAALAKGESWWRRRFGLDD